MKVTHLLAAVLAGAAVDQAISQSNTTYNQVSMCVTTAIGTCGNFCQPFECTPNYTLVESYEEMVFDVAGAPGSNYVLFFGFAAPGCLPVPNIEGALSTWTVAAPLRMGYFIDAHYRPDLPCQPSATTHVLNVPLVTPGVDIRFQLLGLDGYERTSPVLSFSRPTEVRTR